MGNHMSKSLKNQISQVWLKIYDKVVGNQVSGQAWAKLMNKFNQVNQAKVNIINRIKVQPEDF
jgi:hypothetical protein